MGTIFILKHKDSKFTGYMLGVGFFEGRGSTSSDRDAKTLVDKHGCKDVTAEYWAKKKKTDALEKAREVKKANAESKKKSEKAEKKEEEPKAEEKK